MRFLKLFTPLFALALGAFALAQPKSPACCQPATVAAKADAPAAKKFPRGHKHASPEVLEKRHRDAFLRHGHRNRALPQANPAQFDIRALSWTGPIQDQGQCGSCWDVSACGVCTDAFIKAGIFSPTDASKTLSPQFILDQCKGINNGGCDGDDAPTVLDACKSIGIPTTADYGPYQAGPGRCRYTNQKLWQVQDWAFCTPAQEQGVASVQDIKNALVAHGTVSTAVAADSSWDSVGTDGVIPYENSNNIDHDVAIVGWDDTRQIPRTKSPGAWIVKNQWGVSWGNNGYAWMAYGSHSIGTEAAYVILTAPTPPAPPVPPTPPTPPVPPMPPVPPVPPAPTGTTITLSGALAPGTYQVVPAGSAVIRSDMTLGELMKVLQDAARSAPPLKP